MTQPWKHNQVKKAEKRPETMSSSCWANAPCSPSDSKYRDRGGLSLALNHRASFLWCLRNHEQMRVSPINEVRAPGRGVLRVGRGLPRVNRRGLAVAPPSPPLHRALCPAGCCSCPGVVPTRALRHSASAGRLAQGLCLFGPIGVVPGEPLVADAPRLVWATG